MPTALEYLHEVGASLGGYGPPSVTTSDGTTSSLVDAALVNSNLSSKEVADYGVLIESGACAGQVGRATSLARGTGAISLATVFSSLIPSGTAYSLYDSTMPPLRVDFRPSLLQQINEALRYYLWVEDVITLTGVTGRQKYPLSRTTYPWLTTRERVIEVGYPTTSTEDTPVPLNQDLWTYETVGETRRLTFPSAPFTTGQSVPVRVYRPANSRLKRNASLRAVLTGTAVTSVTVAAGGYYTALPTIAPASGAATFTAVMAATPGPITSVTVTGGGVYVAGQPPALTVTRNAADTGWADQTSQEAGLVTITDEALSDIADVRPTALWLAYRALAAQQQPGSDVKEWLGKAELWGREAAELPAFGLPSNEQTGNARIEVAYVAARRGWGRR